MSQHTLVAKFPLSRRRECIREPATSYARGQNLPLTICLGRLFSLTDTRVSHLVFWKILQRNIESKTTRRFLRNVLSPQIIKTWSNRQHQTFVLPCEYLDGQIGLHVH
jgi:hypothetical protein